MLIFPKCIDQILRSVLCWSNNFINEMRCVCAWCVCVLVTELWSTGKKWSNIRDFFHKH